MTITYHSATTSKDYALLIMRKHNKESKTSRAFLLKEKIAVTFNVGLRDGFVISTYNI